MTKIFSSLKIVITLTLLSAAFSCSSSSKQDIEESLVLNKTEITGVEGKSYVLKAEVTPKSSFDKLSWSSSNASVAQVSGGIVRGLSEGTAIITASIGSFSSSCKVTVEPAYNGYGYVDMGVSVKWATCNIGAETPYDSGDYFPWGETSPKKISHWYDYKFWIYGDDIFEVKFRKYVTSPDRGPVDGMTELELSDDAARARMGGNWRMPSWPECKELADNTDFKTYRNGVLLTSKINGKTLFFPFAGYYDNDGKYQNYARYYGEYAHVWTTSMIGYIEDHDCAYAVSFSFLINGKENGWADIMYRRWSCPVRGVFN